MKSSYFSGPTNTGTNTKFPAAVKHNIHGFFLLRGDHDFLMGIFDNPCFFRRYLTYSISQYPGMVQTHRSNNGNGRIHGIGRIQAAAQACFQNDHIHLVLGKITQGGHGQDFEIGQDIAFILDGCGKRAQDVNTDANSSSLIDPLKSSLERRLSLSQNTDTLIDLVQMRGSIQSDLIACFLQNTG